MKLSHSVALLRYGKRMFIQVIHLVHLKMLAHCSLTRMSELLREALTITLTTSIEVNNL